MADLFGRNPAADFIEDLMLGRWEIAAAVATGPSTSSNGVWFVCPRCNQWAGIAHVCPATISVDAALPVATSDRRLADQDEITALCDKWPREKRALMYQRLHHLGERLDACEQAIRKGYGAAS